MDCLSNRPCNFRQVQPQGMGTKQSCGCCSTRADLESKDNDGWTPLSWAANGLRLLDKCTDEMAIYLYDKFDVLVTTSCISRALASAGRSKKVARRVASERNADLRDFYLHKRSAFRSYHMVYIDEPGSDDRIGFRKTA